MSDAAGKLTDRSRRREMFYIIGFVVVPAIPDFLGLR